jgi:aspartokinase/homoserine dehydrogenase 1
MELVMLEKFIAQINQQKKFLKENLKWTCVWSLCLIPENDFDEDGIDLKGWQSAIDKGELIKKKSKDLNLRNSILWISLQTKVFLKHTSILQSVAVVTCNKIVFCLFNYNYKT